jgi:GxxExxY protein
VTIDQKDRRVFEAGRSSSRIELSPEHESAARQVIDSAFAVYGALGPGLLESLYEECLAVELSSRGFGVERQVAVPVIYRTVCVDTGYRIDLVVNGLVAVEVKATERLMTTHEAELLTYLKLSGLRLGLLITFNVAPIRCRRVALYDLESSRPAGVAVRSTKRTGR